MDFSTAAILAFLGVILIDVVLSGDNAVIIGTLAASLPDHQRKKAVFAGMGIAVVARILLSLVAVKLLLIPGLQFFGGILLLYVAYGMWKDLDDDGSMNDSTETKKPRSFGKAMVAITIADLSMSLDNVLAVAGTAKDHWEALIFGLFLSVAIMMFGALLVAKLVKKYAWIAWVGLVFVLFIAGKMIYHGYPEVPVLFHNVVAFFN
jgi:YjbE family integral membrane protein